MQTHIPYLKQIPNSLITLSFIIIGFVLVLTGLLPLQLLGGALLLFALILPSLRPTVAQAHKVSQPEETRPINAPTAFSRDYPAPDLEWTSLAPALLMVEGHPELDEDYRNLILRAVDTLSDPQAPMSERIQLSDQIKMRVQTLKEEGEAHFSLPFAMPSTDELTKALTSEGIWSRGAAQELARQYLRDSEQGGEVITHERSAWQFDGSHHHEPAVQEDDEVEQPPQRGAEHSL